MHGTSRIQECSKEMSLSVHAGDKTHDADFDSVDVNKLLFSAIVQSNWTAFTKIVDVAIYVKLQVFSQMIYTVDLHCATN